MNWKRQKQSSCCSSISSTSSPTRSSDGCEKPLTRTSAEAAVLTKLAAERKLKLQVGHVERFNPALVAARD